MESALPEGRGIAAKYPGDRGIEQDPAVVFADDFETTKVGPMPDGYRKTDEKKWDDSWGRCGITDKAENVHSGKRAMEMAVPRPGPQSRGAAVQRNFEEGFDTLFLRYYAKLGKDNDLYHGGAHNGGLIDARARGVAIGCAGVRADGANKYCAMLDTYRSEEKLPSPGPLVVYCYHMDQGGRWGDQFYPSGKAQPAGRDGELFGEQFVPRADFIPDQGRWYCYELMARANTPGKHDGRVAFWVDGKLHADFPNLRLRSVEALKGNVINLNVHAGNFRVTRDIFMWFDDVVVATAYVGPQLPAR
jgi:hypothetical protein